MKLIQWDFLSQTLKIIIKKIKFNKTKIDRKEIERIDTEFIEGFLTAMPELEGH